MKTTATLLFLLFGFLCYSQNTEEPKSIDPRQFVEVYYHKDRSDIAWLIGEFNPSNQIFNQKIDRVDNNGVLEIKFLLEDLVQTSNFYGAISIEAEVYGRDGSRKIEVNPYSLVGQDQSEFGIKSISINDFYGKISSFLSETQRTNIDFNNFRTIVRNIDPQLLTHLEYLGYRLMDDDKFYKPYYSYQVIDSSELDYLLQNKLDIKELIFRNLDTIEQKKLSPFFDKTSFTSRDLDYLANRVSNVIQREIERNTKSGSDNPIEQSVNNRIMIIQNQLSDISEYLTAILDNSEDTKRAFSTLSGYDNMTLNKLLVDLNLITNSPISETNKLDWYNSVTKILNEFNQLTYPFYDIGTSVNQQEKDQVLKEKLSSLIFNRLVNAQIDLNKENVQPGEKLTIHILWNDANKKNESTKLNLCSFYIDQTGAQFKIMDAFYLVERINQGKGDSLQSPSNFKGAGGASLMLTYYRNDLRSNAIQKDILNKKCNVFWNTMNALQPSFGLNVSYLDFDVSKDFEVGTGLCLGFFRNQLMFTYGIDLHKTHENWYNASYFGVGFSFINIADNIRNKD